MLRDHLAVRQADMLARVGGHLFDEVNLCLRRQGLELVRSKRPSRKYLGTYYLLCLRERAVLRTHLDLAMFAYDLRFGNDPRVPLCDQNSAPEVVV